jgi:2-C-methyl-D-erythritol 4-phosphate cytidylyltransferase/2-C-methyl-D-erythritol 2,4-cyclodiphosphate synthase
MAETLAGAARVTRIGQGFDAHRFGPGDEVWLCGIRIPHTHGLVGHSDADAGLHALTDALLGAIGEGDIGDHFPPSDPKWKGAPSSTFLHHAAKLVAERGARLINADDAHLRTSKDKAAPRGDASAHRRTPQAARERRQREGDYHGGHGFHWPRRGAGGAGGGQHRGPALKLLRYKGRA